MPDEADEPVPDTRAGSVPDGDRPAPADPVPPQPPEVGPARSGPFVRPDDFFRSDEAGASGAPGQSGRHRAVPAVNPETAGTPAGTPPAPDVTQPLPVVGGELVQAGPAEPRHRTRRWFLAGAGALVVGAGAGVAVEAARQASPPPPRPAPQALVDAAGAEVALLSSVAATAKSDRSLGPQLDQLRRDHRAHLAALRAELAAYDQPSRAARRRAQAAAGSQVHDRTALSTAETTAAHHAALRAEQLAGTDPRVATLLASIAACESSHAQVLT